jgi:FlaA1/EpsC-like NDP-sugar epimerase
VKGRNRRRILEQLSVFPVHVQTVPDFDHIVSGKSRVDDLSDVDVKDLLGRDPVPANPELLEGCISGKSVMVTGAGGSIGSELCRQICTLKPKQLILFEISESALYDINRQLKSMAADPDCKIVALLGSVYDQERVREVMDAFSIQTVYHAAAYKHVPIVEDNLFEGIHNNVYGTLHTVQAAIEANVETFVLVSTDKAVSPTSVMGATKRLAELILQAQHSRDSKTRICMVRFGNVLESSGSVVPLFREQFRNGGPVTVTHRDIIRYFMTIPEAAELVIQAGSMAEGGDVFVLDMGEPVRIRDLAYRMINLMGLSVLDDENPDGDIEIKYIGLRPAEKLYEELLIGDNVSGTGHPLIMRAHEDFIPYESLLPLLRQLSGFAEDRDRFGARDWLKQVVSGYQPTNDIDDLVWRERQVGNVDVETKVIRFTPDSGRDRRHH